MSNSQIDQSGIRYWYNENGELDREDGSALEDVQMHLKTADTNLIINLYDYLK